MTQLKKSTLIITLLLFISATTVSAQNVQINSTNFPCANFRAFLTAQTWGQKGYVTPAEIAGITEISASNWNIADLTGIEFFTNLTILSASRNQLTSLDVSALTKLQSLFIFNNQLSVLDVSASTELQTLIANDNRLTTLNVQGLTNLETLYAYNNQLKTLNVSALANLKVLYVYENQLSVLDVSGLTNLQQLWVSNNQLTSLDVSGLTNLTFLYADRNQLTSLNVSGAIQLQDLRVNNNQLSALDLTGHTKLSIFEGNNQSVPLTLAGINNNFRAAIELNTPTQLATGIFYSPVLGVLTSTNSAITSSPFRVETGRQGLRLNGTFHFTYIDGVLINEANFPDANFRTWLLHQYWGYKGYILSAQLAGITDIHLSRRNIADLTGIGFFTNLEELNVRNNQLISLDVSGLTNLTVLDVSHNQLTSLNVSGLTNLKDLEVFQNQLTNLNVSSLTNLRYLDVSYNQIAALDVSDLTNLTFLDVGNNQLSTLNVSTLTKLSESRVSNNQLISLNVSGLTYLHTLCVIGNQLSTLNVSGATNLRTLYAENNQLSTLDVSGLKRLNMLTVQNNQLTSLDVSGAVELEVLNVSNNQLSSIDLQSILKLTIFDGSGQTPKITLTGLNNTFRAAIELNNPTELADGISYASGVLTSTSREIESSPFAVQTGQSDRLLSGAFSFEYDERLWINAENFPDPNFRAIVSLYDTDKKGYFTAKDIEKIEFFQLTGRGGTDSRNIRNLAGVEYFVYLTDLHVRHNNLTSLDISTLTRLQTLDASYNNLETIALPATTSIEWLDLQHNKLASLDISTFANLNFLDVRSNELEALNLAGLTSLERVFACENNLASLDVSTLTNLETLWASRNGLTSIQLSGLAKLGNVNLNDNELTTLDVSTLVELSGLGVANNRLSALDVSGLPNMIHGWVNGGGQRLELALFGINSNFSAAIELNNPTFDKQAISYANGILTSTDMEVSESGFAVQVYGSEFHQLSGTISFSYTDGILINEANFPDANFRAWLLAQTWGAKGYITSAELAGRNFLDIAKQNIADLTGIAFFTRLNTLYVSNNKLSVLDVSALTNLEHLSAAGNQLNTLDVSALTKLRELFVSNNQLSTLDVSALTDLQMLAVSNNQLSVLDVSGLTNLWMLIVDNNQLSELDVTGLTKLIFFIGENQSTAVELQRCEIHRHYRLPIALHKPVFWHSEIRFENGVLISECNSVKEVDFQVETIGNAGFTLSGTKSLTYAYDITTDIPHIIIPNPNRVPVAFFNLQGQQLGQEPTRGVFIVRFDDGTSEKRMR